MMNNSLWIETSEGSHFEPILDDILSEILIVGAGITGVTTAYLLCKHGLDVTLVDSDNIGYGATSRNTGKITEQHNIIYSKIKKQHNLETAKKYYELNKEGSLLIKNIIEELKIDCDYEEVPSYLFTQDDTTLDILKEEYEVCKEIGISCEYIENPSYPLNNVKGAIKFNNTAQFNPKKYIDGIVNELTELECKIFDNTPIKSLVTINPCEVLTINNKRIHCKKLIITSHYPFFDGLSFFFTRLKPSRSYIVAGEISDDIQKGTYINVDHPRISLRQYNYNNKKYLLIGGGEHKVGLDTDIDYIANLKALGSKYFGITNYPYEWSTQDYFTTDNMPYVGFINTSRNNIYVATGYCKWGMTNGTAASIVLRDLILNENSNLLDVFYPSRDKSYFTPKSLKENFKVSYHYVLGKIKISSKEMPKIGEGKIVKIHHKKYGVYLDEAKKLHIVDSTCPHLGCALNWNPIEKSWDCPCHGSRFSYTGDVLNGPSTIPLSHYGEKKNSINPNLLSEEMK